VSFYWAEASDASENGIPVQYTESLTPHLRCLQGTNQRPPRCVLLEGTVGVSVACRLHTQRPSPCREFAASFEDGQPHDRCDQARAKHGLPPLTLADWL
jgi:hypothetical protein